ncbi:MAG: tRNA (adenosine(37)-N6)-threonylcarbamoyltransferase complex dimerization subunit type 1 TsaB, partial [Azoarcus sp.]|jgi:tRNA threonylcarbamoyladenosine biosynthesis protein TsaB|nr:tRNA (adenosine(37)-N6)-threonylcarbamoyltransferase complex dimerization subunit type 1 TsaB [Azoarcus sp.]
VELAAPACCAPGELSCPEGEWFGLGSAFAAREAELAPVRARLAGCDPSRVPSAEVVARLVAGQGAAAIVSPERAVPLYVRNKVALTTAERLAQGKKA